MNTNNNTLICRIKAQLDVTPQYTISIPAYKKVNLLKDAVQSCLNQTKKEFEILIIDDCGEGDEIYNYLLSINDRRISYFQNTQNTGMVDNWNRCFIMAKTDWVILLHDDDLLFPDYIEKMDFLRKLYPEKDFFFIMGKRIKLCEQSVSFQRSSDRAKVQKLQLLDVYFGNATGTCCGSCFRRKCMQEIGGFDNSYYPTHDYALGVKAITYSNCVRVYDYPMSIGRDGENTTMRPGLLEQILKKDLVIRRSITRKITNKWGGVFLNYCTNYYHKIIAEVLTNVYDKSFNVSDYLLQQDIKSDIINRFVAVFFKKSVKLFSRIRTDIINMNSY